MESDNALEKIQRVKDHLDPGGTGTGMATSALCRRYNLSSATFYKWKAKYGGRTVSDARRLKKLEIENN